MTLYLRFLLELELSQGLLTPISLLKCPFSHLRIAFFLKYVAQLSA